MKTLALIVSLVLAAGCAPKAPVVTFPLGAFAYEIGALSQRVEQLCQQKKLTAADCQHARELAVAAKAQIHAPPAADTDWAAVFGALMKLALKAAI